MKGYKNLGKLKEALACKKKKHRNKLKSMKNITITLLLIFSTFMFCTNTGAQSINKSNSIDRNKWEKIAEKYDYSKEKEDTKKKEKEKEITENRSSSKLSPVTKEFIKYTLFGIVILILVFIGYRLIRNGKFWDNKKLEKPKVYTLENLEENLAEANIDLFLQDALSSSDFRLSVRLMYLNIIKALSQKEIINWKRDKTNGEYLLEMNEHNLYSDFRKCTLVYEYVWFNELKDFNREQYERIKPAFEQLLAAIK